LAALKDFLEFYQKMENVKPLYIDLQGAKLRVSRQQKIIDLKKDILVNIKGGVPPEEQGDDV
jgi:hypothetical protein